MKTRGLLFLLAASSGLAQGPTFRDLDFEEAQLIPIQGDPYGRVQFADAFPGWTGYIDTNRASAALYNNLFLDSAGIGIQSSASPYAPSGVLSDEYCLSLQGGYIFTGPDTYYFGASSIAQSGQIPTDARSIQFKAWTANVSLTFAGHNIPLSVLTSQGYYNVLLGGDISQFAGQTGELRFISGQNFLDNIQFSASAIPEPSVLTLSALGTLLLTWRFLRRTRS